MLLVKSIAGEPSAFLVQGDTLLCSNPQCGKLVRRLPASFVRFTERQREFLRTLGLLGKVDKATENRAEIESGEQCKKCGAVLEQRFHRVDVVEDWCSCEFYEMVLRPARRKANGVEIASLRCHHLEAARSFCLDAVIGAHARMFEKKRK